MPQWDDVLSRLSEAEVAALRRVGQAAFANPGTAVRMDASTWQSISETVGDSYQAELERLIDEEQSIEQDVMRLRLR